MKQIRLYVFFTIIFHGSNLNCQTVAIGHFLQFGGTGNILNHYENYFGAGNVQLTAINETSDLTNYDIIIVNSFGNTYSNSFSTALINFVQNGKHLVLSTEGGNINTGGRLMSIVWNSITGQNITETGQVLVLVEQRILHGFITQTDHGNYQYLLYYHQPQLHMPVLQILFYQILL